MSTNRSPRLHPFARWLVGPGVIFISVGDSRIRLEDGSLADPSCLARALDGGDLSILDGLDGRAEATHAIAQAGALTTATAWRRTEHLGVTVLGQLLRPTFAAQPSMRPFCVYAGGEALVIASAQARLVRAALRFFVSRMDDGPLLDYAPAAASRDAAWIAGGDRPEPQFLLDEETTESLAVDSGAVCVRLGATPAVVGVLVPRGSADTSCAGPMRQVDEFHEASGRLAATEELHAEVIAMSRSVATVVIGLQALPNLAYCDPNAKAPSRFCAGVDPDPIVARAKCYAEGIERFALGSPRASDLRRCSADELPGPYLDPRLVAEYSAEQRARLGLSEFDPTAANWWTSGEQGGLSTFLPAALVFCPFAQPGWLAPGHTSSNGAAAHPDRATAITRAWLELVERDAFWRCWFSRRPPPRLDAAAVDPEVGGLKAALTRYGDVEVLLLDSPEPVAVVMAVCASPRRLTLGAAAGTDLAALCTKALQEVWIQVTRAPLRPVEMNDVRSPEDHGALYSSEGWTAKGGWLLAGDPAPSREQPPPRPVDHPPGRVAAHVRQFGGTWVARALDAHLLPLTFGYDQEPTGRADLRQVLVRRSPTWNGEALEPHPFA